MADSSAIACIVSTCPCFVGEIGTEILQVSPFQVFRVSCERETWALPWVASQRTEAEQVLCLHRAHSTEEAVVVVLQVGDNGGTALPNVVVPDDSCSNLMAHSNNCFVDSISTHTLMPEDFRIDIHIDTWESDLVTMVSSGIRHQFLMVSVRIEMRKNTRTNKAVEVAIFEDDLTMQVACVPSSGQPIPETLQQLLAEIHQ
jgi:hypothetical protein